MRRQRRFIPLSVLLSAIAVLLVAVPVLAIVYQATFTITEDNGNTYEMLPVSVTANIEWMVDNGFISATGLDTLVETLGGTAYPHMLTEDTIWAVSAVPSDSQTNLYFTTGNTALSNFDIIAGYGGYVSITDAAALEPTNDFRFDADGYYSSTLSGSSMSKEDAVVIYADGAGNVVGAILGNDTQTSPTGFNDPDAAWADEAEAYDGDTGTDAECAGVGTDTWSEYIELTHAAAMCKGVRYFADYDADTFDEIDVDAYYNGAWHDVYQGSFADSAWEERNFPDGAVYSVTKFRFRFYNEDVLVAGADTAELFEVDFLELNPSISMSGAVTTGEQEVVFFVSGANLVISVDGNLTLGALGGNTVPGNGNDWYLLSEGVPYLTEYQHTVAGTLIVHYAPATYIEGTVLPDLEGAAQNGAFSWGTDPSGVDVALGSLVAGDQPVPGTTTERETRDILPETAGGDIHGDGTVTKASTLANPLRAVITVVSDSTTLSEIQVWRWLGLAFLLFITVGAAKMIHGHKGIVAIIAGVAIGGLVAFDNNIFPVYLVVLSVVMLIMGVIAERSPSL